MGIYDVESFLGELWNSSMEVLVILVRIWNSKARLRHAWTINKRTMPLNRKVSDTELQSVLVNMDDLYKRTHILCTGWPVNYGLVFLVPCKMWLCQCLIPYSMHCTVLQYCTLHTVYVTFHKEHPTMFNWSGCTL